MADRITITADNIDSIMTDTNNFITSATIRDQLNLYNIVSSSINAFQINTYEDALNFKERLYDMIYIKSEVLLQLIDRIKELEANNAKNWTELLEDKNE